MKKTILLLVAALATTTVWAEGYITDVMVIGGTQTEVNNLKNTYTSQGWKFIEKDLNQGCGSSSDYIYMLYKEVTDTTGATAAEQFITDFVVSTASGTVKDTLTHKGRTYHLVPYDGGEHFESVQGDLNSNCRTGCDNIHLYYTTTNQDDRGPIVKSITFDNKQDGAVVNEYNNESYDLNAGCGSGSAYIYMHTDKSQGWIVYKNTTGTQCYITGFDGPKAALKSVIIPIAVDSAEVLYALDQVFSGFKNLETMDFHNAAVIEQMPSVRGCTKFKRVSTSDSPELSGVSPQIMTPPTMKNIPSYAFVGTAITDILLYDVNYIGSHAFDGCNNLTNVILMQSALIEPYAFANIKSNCEVSYRGSMSDWDPGMFLYSPNLYVYNAINQWLCGGCGGDTITSHNNLYWTLDADGHLNIDSYYGMWQHYPQEQVITTHNWEKRISFPKVIILTLEHVDSIREREFQNYTTLVTVDAKSGLRAIGGSAFVDCSSLTRVNFPSCLEAIGDSTFRNCNSLTDIYFDGTDAQWKDVKKGNGWKPDATKAHWHCTVSFDTKGHGTAPAAQYIQWSNLGKATEPTAPTATGYTFKGWYPDEDFTQPWNFNNVVPGDMTLYAKWEAVRGDINVDGKVDVSDVNIIINIMLGKTQASSYPGNPDLNNDNKVDVSDVNAVINIMLGKE